MKGKSAIGIWLLPILFFSCATIKQNEDEHTVLGMVTDSKSLPVVGYVISSNGKQISSTNESGLFELPFYANKQITVTGEKEGWECMEIQKTFDSTKSVFCIQIKSMDELVGEIESALDEKEYEKVAQLVQSAGRKNEADERLQFLSAIAFYLQENYAESEAALSQIKSIPQTKKSIELFNEIIRQKNKENDE